MHAPETHQKARDLLADVLDNLEDNGWRKIRVDTYEHPDRPDETIRHHYAGGEYRLIRAYPNGSTIEVSWDTRRDIPAPETILQQLPL